MTKEIVRESTQAEKTVNSKPEGGSLAHTGIADQAAKFGDFQNVSEKCKAETAKLLRKRQYAQFVLKSQPNSFEFTTETLAYLRTFMNDHPEMAKAMSVLGLKVVGVD